MEKMHPVMLFHPIVFLFLTLVFSYVIFCILWKLGSNAKLNLPPWPPKVPIFGNFHQITHMVHQFFHQMSLKYGPLVQWKPNQSSQKIVVIMGATGTGKSKLSIDLATYFSPSEIINSDKIQFYRSLDILTNKMPMKERRGIPHHLIDEYDSINGELTAVYFRSLAGTKVSEIWSRNSLPILVGGSNSFIHAFLAKNFSADPTYSLDVGTEVSAELGYDCCFLWVDVALPVLKEYLSFRVDQMICSGMLEELKLFYESDTPSVGIAKSIGVPEFAEFFKVFPSGNHDMETKGNSSGTNRHVPAHGDCLKHHGNCPESDAASCKKMLFQESLQAMKDNTYALAKKQIKKIELLKSSGWNIQRLDATNAIRAILETESDSVGKSSRIWEKEILEPSIKMVNQFLNKVQVRSSK